MTKSVCDAIGEPCDDGISESMSRQTARVTDTKKVSGELFCLTYGALVAQILKVGAFSSHGHSYYFCVVLVLHWDAVDSVAPD